MISLQKIIYVLIISLFYSPLYAQFAEEEPAAHNAFPREEFLERNDLKQVLANGPYFENKYLNAIGHPYYISDEYAFGEVLYRGMVYKGVELKYDIYNKQLIVKHPQPGFSTVLPKSFVRTFTIYNTTFRKIRLDGDGDYFQVIYDKGYIDCYFNWNLKHKETITDNQVLVPVFNKLSRKVFLSKGGEMTLVKNRRTLLKFFSGQKKAMVADYIKNHKLKIKSASSEEMKDLLLFCNSIINQSDPNPSAKDAQAFQIERPLQDLMLLKKLPEYSNGENEQTGQADKQVGDEYIQTTGVSRDQIIKVGKKDSYRKGHKCHVTGKVINKDNGGVIIGATIYLKELDLGFISNVNGVFFFSVEPGEYTLEVGHMTMDSREYVINVLSSGEVDFELQEKHIQLQEVQVLYKRKSNVEGMMMGYERISNKAIKEIPVVLGEKDILKVAQMLPGVQNAGEGTSGVNVRGGSSDQNLFMINHVTVYNTSHLFGFFSAFSPDIISDFSLYKNNIPAKYGGRIASIFELNTRDGNPKEFFFQGGVSPVTGHVSVEGPLVKDKITLVASARSTYSDWLLKKVKNSDIRNSEASFYDGSLELNAKINESNKLKLFAYQSYDDFNLSNRNEYEYRNTGRSISWDHTFKRGLNSHLVYAYSAYDFNNIDKNNISEAYRQNYNMQQHEARLDIQKTDVNNHRIEFGLGSILYQLDKGNIRPFGEESKRTELNLGMEYGLEHSAYISDEFKLNKRLGVLVGLRYSYYQALGPQQVNIYKAGLPKLYYNVQRQESFSEGEVMKRYDGLEPRVGLNFSLGKNNSIKASYNRLHQYIFLLSNTIAVAPTDQWKLCDYHMLPPRSDQFSVGFYQDLPKYDINFSAESYYKKIDHIAEFRDGAEVISGQPIERLILQGDQNSYGLEMMAKKNRGKLSGWISYTWSRSIVSVDGPEKAMRINNGRPYPSNFDRPHSFNMVSNYRLSRRISLSLNTVFMSGRPVTLPVSFYFTENQQYLYHSERNAYRIPDYFRIDFSVNLEGNLKFKKPAHSFWMLNIYNLTGRNNAYSVFYESKDGRVQGYQLSIFAQPIVTISWNLKFGNYTNE